MTPRRLAPIALALLLAACAACGGRERAAATEPSVPDLRTAPPLTGSYDRDLAALARLDSAAAALARADGCDDAGGCASIPIGERACGGPRTYLVYCRLTTDEDLLRRQAAEIARFEGAMNARYGLASTCEYRMPPAVEAAGGSCRAVRP